MALQTSHLDPEPDEMLMSIGELADSVGVSTRTIRYYEELEILPAPERSAGGTRKYGRQWRFFLEGALALKDVGFSLSEIKLLGRLALGERAHDSERSDMAAVIREKQRNLERRIRLLQTLHTVLKQIEANGTRMTPEEMAAALSDSARPNPPRKDLGG